MEWVSSPAHPLAVNGQSLEYACFGPPPDAAPTLILLHEGLGCTALWRDFPKALAAATGCGVLAYSRSGYGQSSPRDLPWPLDFMSRDATETLPALLDVAGLEQVILFGHSDGATIAAICAGSIVDHRIRGLILEAPHFFTEPDGLAEIARLAADYPSGDLRARLAKYHRDPDMAFRGWVETWLDPGFRDWNVADVIDYIRVPVLAIQGKDDQFGSLAQIEEIETRCYAPVDTLILDECQHVPHHEAADAMIEAVTSFVARLRRIEAAEVAVG
ncbi:MAG: alpha/beta hydrolase [Pseudomonadota bacterium]